MTREEQLDWLYRLRSEIYVYMPKEWLIPMNNALDMSIKALEQEPTTKNDLGVDCISRKAVLDKIKEVCFSKEQKWVDFRVSQGSNGQRDLIINFIEDLPSVQPKPLEKEPILDKIRADINKLTVYYTTKDKGINLISQNAVNRIFDKYNVK